MDCKNFKNSIYKWLDRKLPEAQKAEFQGHLSGCSDCQKESESVRALNGLLQASFSSIEPSKAFERVFWQKVTERQKEPWFARVLKELDSLIPHPGVPQMAMVVLMAFLIGGTGGVVSAMSSTGPSEADRASVQYLSGFPEFKGVPTSSVAAGYLKVIDGSAT